MKSVYFKNDLDIVWTICVQFEGFSVFFTHIRWERQRDRDYWIHEFLTLTVYICLWMCMWNTLWIGKLIFSVWTFVIVRSTVHLEQIWKTIKLQLKCNGFILATKPITFYQFSCASNHVHNYNEPINISIITCCWLFFCELKGIFSHHFSSENSTE